MKAQDLVGLTFNRLTVIELDHRNNKSNSLFWKCRCKCGNIVIARTAVLKNGHKKSCGCLQKETSRAIMLSNQILIAQRHLPNGNTHGLSKIPEYRSWIEMKRRCRKPHKGEEHIWKDRGITVCSRWLNSFENFFADMGSRPSSAHSIDRINYDGNYEPGNCRWATPLEQAANRRPRSEWISVAQARV